jgi:anti-sigma factor RsiW
VNCTDALDLLLEADLLELEGKGDSELASHVRSCPECRTAAGRILEWQDRLRESLSSARSRTPVEQALRTAAVNTRRRSRRRRMWQAAIPLAAAAGMAGIIVARNGDNGALEHVWERNTPQAAKGLDLVTPPGKDVAVFELEDRPDIVVVWFFEKGE